MSMRERTSRRILQRLIAGLNRADEVGGEIRDFIQDRVLVDERYVRLRRRIAALRGTTYVSRAEHDAQSAAEARARADAAPPPASAAPAAQEGLSTADIPAQLYGKNSCPWTGRAITLLESLKVDFDYIDLDDSDNDHYAPRLEAETTQRTTPYVFVRGEFVGGFNALDELHRAGKLEYLLMSPEERKNANPALDKVVVTPRTRSDEVPPGEAS